MKTEFNVNVWFETRKQIYNGITIKDDIDPNGNYIHGTIFHGKGLGVTTFGFWPSNYHLTITGPNKTTSLFARN